MKLFTNRKTAKTNFTGRKTNTTKLRFTILASIVLVAISSTVALSSTTAANSISELLINGVSFFKTSGDAAATTNSTGLKNSVTITEINQNNTPELSDEVATVTTDRTDYNPGETVIITGNGFASFEQVLLKVNREDVKVADYQVTADEFGNVINRDFIIGEDDIGASFVLTAIGTTSSKIAESRFTDGTYSYTPVTQSYTGATAVQVNGSTSNTKTFSQTITSPSDAPKNSAVAFTSIPNTATLGGNATTPFPGTFTVSATPNTLSFSAVNQGLSWDISVVVPGNTPTGVYSAIVKATPTTGSHLAGAGTQIILEVKNTTPTDTTAPNTTLTSGTYVNNTWTNQNITVDLSSADNTGGVGMQSLTYTVTGPNSVSATTTVSNSPFTASIPVSSEGNTTISYSAKDLANNTETTRYFYVNLDKTPPVIALTGGDQTITVGGTFAEPGYSATDNRAPINLTSSVVVTGSVDTNTVGDYTLLYNVSDSAGNAASEKTRIVHVVKSDQQITLGALTAKTYGDAPFTVSATASSGLTVTFSATGNCTSGGTNGTTITINGAGSCTVTASQAGDATYKAATDAPQTFTIAKATPTATLQVNNSPVTYDATAKSATVGITASSVTGSVANVLTGSAASQTNAGTYAVIADFVPNDTANYNTLTGLSAGNFVINKATPTIAWTNPADITYGTALGATQLSATANTDGSSVYAPATGTVLNAGNETLHVDFTPTDTANYNNASKDVFINVLKLSLTVTASSHTVTYGDAVPTVTSSYATFVSPDTAAVIDTPPTCSTSYTTSSGAGTTQTTSCAGGLDNNYSFSFVSGTVTVNKANADCSSITGYNVNYDGAAHTATGSCTGVAGASNILSGLNLSGTTHTDAGSYPTDPWTFTDVTGNYNNTSGTVADNINKAAADCSSITGFSGNYNGSSHGATGTCTGVDAGGAATGGSLSLGASYTNVPGGTANWTFAGGTNYNDANGSVEISISKANQTISFAALPNKYIGNGGITVSATGGGSGNPVTFSTSTPAVCTSGGTNGAAISFVGLGTCTVTASQVGNINYNAASNVIRSFTVNADPTNVVLTTSGHTFIDFDCVTNVIAATVTDGITGLAIQNASVTFTIGTQSATATTNASGIASTAIVLNQPTGSVTVSASYAGSTNGFNLPGSASTTKTIGGSPNVGPGQDATSLYTGSLWFWTTSSTSSTATLTLSATIKDTFEYCPGDITKAKVSFLISTNGGTSFSPVSSAQNLPVGLVNPNDPTTGTASAISQYNIGTSQSVTLTVRVIVGGQYNSSGLTYDVPVTIGKPGLANSLMGGGRLKNDGMPFPANGFLGANSIDSVFGSQVIYTKSGTNPKGDVTVTITSCNKPDGSVETGCTISTSTKWHKYFIKSNAISELSLISGSASFGSKTNVSELLPDGTKVSLDGGNTMQLVFTPIGKPFPTGMSVSSGGNCTNSSGCASIVIYKSNGLGGGVWYSSAWGQSGTTAPRTYLKNVFSGNVFVQ